MRRISNRALQVASLSARAPRANGVSSRGSAAPCVNPTCFSSALRHLITGTSGSTGPSFSGMGLGGNSPQPDMSAKKELPLGTVTVGGKTFTEEVTKSDVPVLLYFHVENHPEVVKFSSLLMTAVERLNKEYVLEKAGHASTTTAEGFDRIVLKLAMCDVATEGAVAARMGVTNDNFPMLFFVYEGEVVDRLIGMVPEAQIKDAINSYIKWVEEELIKKATGEAEKQEHPEKPSRMSNDDENVLTLLQTGAQKLKENDIQKGEFLFDKALKIATEEIEKLKLELGLDRKKMTPELHAQLKRDPHYHAAPQALSGLALVALALKKHERARFYCDRIRSEFPWAVAEMREVAETVCKIGIIYASGYNIECDGYPNLVKSDFILDDPVEFYQTRLKLAVAHYMELKPDAAADELLKLIRAEPLMMKELQAAGIIGEDKTQSPARTVIHLLMESLGSQNDTVVKTRKKLAALLHC